MSIIFLSMCDVKIFLTFTSPNMVHYWASTVRDSWLDVPEGIGCIFVSPNPHPAVGYMKQKPALVWPMDLTSTITFGILLSTMWLEFKDMAQDPLVRREPVSASCNRRPDEGLETQRYSLYPNEHPANMRDTPPNHYWASTVRDSWLDVHSGIGCIFVSPNPHPAVGYMKQKPALLWPMDLASCP
jgi:hypothetical protein